MEQFTLTLPQMLSEKQTARLLACSVAALRRWRREGRGPIFTYVESCIRYDLRLLERFLAEHSSGYEKAAEWGSATATRSLEERGK